MIAVSTSFMAVPLDICLKIQWPECFVKYILPGYRIIDRALDTVYDGLTKNPYGFHKFENDLFSFRYAITSAIEDIPALVFTFVLDENKDVVLKHVEEYSPY